MKVAFPTGRLTEEFKTQTFMGFEGTRDQVMHALSKQGNESIIQTNVGDASLSTSEKEKKKKDAERSNLALALEQQRVTMMNQLGVQIGKLTEQIEKDQIHLDALKNKKDALVKVGRLVDANQINQKTPHHDLLDQAGIQDKNKFINQSQEEQRNTLRNEHADVDDKISELVEKIEANMNRLDSLVQAKEDLKNGVDPREVQKALEEKGIVLKEASPEKGTVKESLEKSIDNLGSNQENLDIDVEDLTAIEQVKFYNKASVSGKFSQNELDSFKELFTDEAQAKIDGQSNKFETALPNNSM